MPHRDSREGDPYPDDWAHTAKGKETKDVIEARRAYGAISNELVAYVKKHVPEKIANKDLHGFSCGMAGKLHKIPSEDWLQLKGELRNPYMGRAMFT